MNFRAIEIAKYAFYTDGTLNDTMKKNIRAKISSYLQRAEALKAPADTPAAPTPALANPTAAREDPDALQIMQKFQGYIHFISFDSISIGFRL